MHSNTISTDVLRTIILKSLEGADHTLIRERIYALNNTNHMIRKFIHRDRIFWKQIFAMLGLRLDNNVRHPFAYFMGNGWIKHYYSDKFLYTWNGYGVFENDNGYFITPGNACYERVDVDGDYLIAHSSKTLVIFHQSMKKIVSAFEYGSIADVFDVFIHQSNVGVIFGTIHKKMDIIINAFLIDLSGAIRSMSYLMGADKYLLFYCGYVIDDRYSRYDCSPAPEAVARLMQDKGGIVGDYGNKGILYYPDETKKIKHLGENTGEQVFHIEHGDELECMFKNEEGTGYIRIIDDKSVPEYNITGA